MTLLRIRVELIHGVFVRIAEAGYGHKLMIWLGQCECFLPGRQEPFRTAIEPLP